MTTLADLTAAGFDLVALYDLGGFTVYRVRGNGVATTVNYPPQSLDDQRALDALVIPNPNPPAPAPIDVNAATIEQRAAQAIANLENAAAGWGALTAAQKDAAMLLAVRVCARLARLATQTLDQPGA